jgi:hypothetical protein
LGLFVDYVGFVVEDRMVVDLMMMFVVDLYEMVLNFVIIMMVVDLVVVDLMMLMDNLLDEIMIVVVVETLVDDQYDQLNHPEQTLEDEVDENLHFVHINYVVMDVQRVEHLNFVVEKIVDNRLHVLMHLEYHMVVLVEFVIVVVVVFENMDLLVVVDQTSFDYLFEKKNN